jgi:hypothetical protein
LGYTHTYIYTNIHSVRYTTLHYTLHTTHTHTHTHQFRTGISRRKPKCGCGPSRACTRRWRRWVRARIPAHPHTHDPHTYTRTSGRAGTGQRVHLVRRCVRLRRPRRYASASRAVRAMMIATEGLKSGAPRVGCLSDDPDRTLRELRAYKCCACACVSGSRAASAVDCDKLSATITVGANTAGACVQCSANAR